MERIEFNTGRKYAANGQNIVAVCDGQTVWFKDEARLIIGRFEMDEFDTFNQKTVMYYYDNNKYFMACDLPEIEPARAEPSKSVLYGLWCIEDGESVLCEVDGGIYCEQVFTDIESAQAYAEQANADWTEQAQRHGWKGAATYFAAPLPVDMLLPEPKPLMMTETVWELQSATVALSYTAIIYTRKTDEMVQTFQAMVWNNGEMTLFATETWHGTESGFVLANIPRSYLNSDAEITEAFHKVCFCGVAQ